MNAAAMNKQRVRVAERLAYVYRTMQFPLDQLTKSALRIEVENLHRVAFARHEERVQLCLSAHNVEIRRAA